MSFGLVLQVPTSPIFKPCGVQSPLSKFSPCSTGFSSLSSSPTMPLMPLRVKENVDSPLKRRRPERLDIPVGTGFGNVGGGFGLETTRRDQEKEEKLEELVMEVDQGDDGYYSVYCKRGKRRRMEDRYSAFVDVQGDSTQAFFGVYDGHGGAKAAEFVTKNLANNVMSKVSLVGRDDEDDVKLAVKCGYLTTDMEFLKQNVDGGACCVTALIRHTNLVVSNVGDCRAVMSRGGIAEALTSDHQPSRADEKDRIESLGGYVDCFKGVWRIQGSLAVTRGIGDRHFKQWLIAEPETKILEIKPDFEFLILASDGLWDKVSNQEAVDIIRPLFINRDQPADSFSACRMLAELAALRGSIDDISVMVIPLHRFLQWSTV